MTPVVVVCLWIIGILIVLNLIFGLSQYGRHSYLLIVGQEKSARLEGVMYFYKSENPFSDRDLYRYTVSLPGESGVGSKQYVDDSPVSYYVSDLLDRGDSVAYDDGRTVPVLVNGSGSMLVVGGRADILPRVAVVSLVLLGFGVYGVYSSKRSITRKG